MNANDWHQKWQKNEIGFHEREANPLLVKYFSELALKKGSRVFLPLCGKTSAIGWLLAHGYRVAGVELSPIAIDQLFAELGVKPQIATTGNLTRYSTENLDIFVGDFFDLSKETLGVIDATYDRAALVALPQDVRGPYTQHLKAITQNAPQLLICFEYDQSQMEGPPFSIPGNEIKTHYSTHYAISQLASVNLPNGLKGKIDAKETVWLLKK